jgi:4-amino-4-deoxy-L-arabinose transferase-like glycosyltransferase
MQASIDALSVLAVFLLARRWMGHGASVLSAGIVAINPFLVYFSGLILSETLFAAMLIWGMALTVMRKPAAWWGGVVLLACSILVRPSAIALPVLLGIAAALVNRGSRQPFDSRWVPPVGAVMVLATLIVLLPWAWRNQRVLGSWIWMTTNSGITLYDGLNPDATGASDQTFVRHMPQLRSMGEVGRSEYLGERAWQFVREHPARAAQLALIKTARTWSPLPLSKEYGTNPKLVAVALGYMIPLYLLILLGLRFGQSAKSTKVLLMLPALYFTIAHAASVGSLRYRIPADVPMAVVAGLGIQAAIARRQTVSGLRESQLTGCEP